MALVNKIKRKIISMMAPKGKLERELYYLRRKIRKADIEIEDIHYKPFGSCCSYCAYPELHELEDKQDRRIERARYLEKKLKK